MSVTRYFNGTGTVNFFIAVRPASDEIWIANTEALNLVRFEPNVKGHIVDNRVTRVDSAGVVTAFDLNPGVDYLFFPNNAARATALAQPTAIAFTPDGAAFWLTGFGTDRIAKIDAVVTRIETGPTTGIAADPRNKRGPRGLALQPANSRLFILNRISNTISIVSTATELVLGEIAWDVGDPAGSMQTVTSLGGAFVFSMHPMKGPITTQTLRGLANVFPLHWRGDRANFTAFNPAFASLLGGTPLSSADINAFQDFVLTIVVDPNPNQNPDRTMPALFPPGDPEAGDPNDGRSAFINDNFQTNPRCTTCHGLTKGTNGVIIAPSTIDPTGLLDTQPLKTPHLRNVHQMLHFNRSANAVSLSGFGLTHDGLEPDFLSFFSQPFFGSFATGTARRRGLSAFMQCFDTGSAPAAGYTRTVNAGGACRR